MNEAQFKKEPNYQVGDLNCFEGATLEEVYCGRTIVRGDCLELDNWLKDQDKINRMGK